MKKCCGTGPRPKTLNMFMNYGNLKSKKYLDYLDAISVSVFNLIKQGFDYFISGGAIGFDLDFAETILHIRDNTQMYFSSNKKIYLEIAVPCVEQEKLWREKDKARYKSILKQADYVTILSKVYTKNCMQKRNEYMVDSAEKVFAIWNGLKFGGTWNTIKYSKSENKPIEILKLKDI